MDYTELIPFCSLVVIPLVGWLHRQLTKLSHESIEQETDIAGLKLYIANLDKAMARRSELDVLVARMEAVAHRVERTEASIDKLRNGHH
jgi:uncharacterized coiled-coil protein SlyX